MEYLGRVLIILLNHNNYDYTKECIKSLMSTTYLHKEILVIDDYSSSREVEQLHMDFPDVHFLQNEENLHYCKSFNVGIGWGLKRNYDYFFLLNNDTSGFSTDYFEAVLNRFRLTKNAGMVGSLCFDYDGNYRRSTIASRRFGINMNTPTEGYVIKREVFEEIGGLNASLIIYMEDLDFIRRMINAGWITSIEPSVSFDHLGGVTTKKTPLYSTYLRVRNIVWLARDMGGKRYFWMINQVRANAKQHFSLVLKLLCRGKFLQSFLLALAIGRGLKEGFLTKLDAVFNQRNVQL